MARRGERGEVERALRGGESADCAARTVIFFSPSFLLFSLPRIIFSLPPPPPQTFLYAPPIFLYLPYSTQIGARSLRRRYIHPFGMYERPLQPAHTSPTAHASCPPPLHPRHRGVGGARV